MAKCQARRQVRTRQRRAIELLEQAISTSVVGLVVGLELARTRLAKVAVAAGVLTVAAGCNFTRYEAAGTAGTAGKPSAICRNWSARPPRGMAGSPGVISTAIWSNSVATGGTIGACEGEGIAGLPQGGDSAAPACLGIGLIDTNEHQPDAHWTFNQVSCDGSQMSISSSSAEAVELAPYFDDTTAVAVPRCDASVRVNGTGSSIYLNGHQYYKADSSVPSIDGGGTVSAWISIPQDGLPTPNPGETTIWPIISTIGNGTNDSCGGYQLDIRLDCAKGPQLSFSYQHQSDTGAPCETAQLLFQLLNPSWAWGSGRWHHVAATYMPQLAGKALVRLYWDIDSLTAHLASSDLLDGQMASPDPGFYVGTRKKDSADPNSLKFTGNVDEVAIFKRALATEDLQRFSLGSTTLIGPSDCLWRVSENRDDSVSERASTAAWNCRDRNVLKVKIHDEDWGSGVVSARLAPPGSATDISPYDHLELVADIPILADTRNGSFEFSLHSGDNVCTWFLPQDETITGIHSYDIPLDNPSYCQTNQSASCQFALNQVEWASVQSSSEYPLSRTGNPEPMTYAIYGLKLVPRGPTSRRASGGILDTSGTCWRTEAFQVSNGSSAKWIIEGLIPGTIGARLTGKPTSGPALVADFGDSTLDLRGCKVNFALASTPSATPVLILQDRAGAWAQWKLSQADENNLFAVVNPTNFATDSKNAERETHGGWLSEWQPWAKFPDFDLGSVSSVKVQKVWDRDWSSASVDLIVTGMSILGDSESIPPCSVGSRANH